MISHSILSPGIVFLATFPLATSFNKKETKAVDCFTQGNCDIVHLTSDQALVLTPEVMSQQGFNYSFLSKAHEHK